MMRRWLFTLALGLPLLPLAQAQEAIQAFDRGSLHHIEADRRGKPFVLVLWSLDCTYCEQSFAALAEARKQYGLDVVTVATDMLEDGDNARLIAAKLGAFGLRAHAWAFGAAPPEQLRHAIDPKWRGELPRSYWFDAEGKRTARSGMITPAMIAGFLR